MSRGRFRQLHLEGLTSDFPAHPAVLAGVGFTSPSDGVTAIIGPSGAGKTTLLRAVAGLEPVTAGSISLDGVRIDQMSPPMRRVSFLPQSMTLLPHLTVEENIQLPLRLRGTLDPSARAAPCRAWIDRCGLGEALGRYPAELSAGQQQRVALARALVAEPAILLLDEPFSHLDPPLRRQLRELLAMHLNERHAQGEAPAVLWATHDPEDLAGAGTHVVVLERGRVSQSGQVSELRARPATEWVRAMFQPNVPTGGSFSGECSAPGRSG